MNHTQLSILMQPEILLRPKRMTRSGSHDNKQKSFSTKKVVFIGTGTSLHCASWARAMVEDLGLRDLSAEAVSSWDFLVSQRVSLPRETLFVVISHRGYAGITAAVLRRLKRAQVVLVCGAGSETGGHASIEASPRELSEAHTMSLMGAMASICEIVSTLRPAQRARITREKNNTAKLLMALTVGFFREKPPALRTARTFYTMGGGAFFAIAQEASLKLIEMAHKVSRPYAIEEFLHGPFAGLKKSDVLIAFQPFAMPKKSIYRSRGVAAFKAARLLGVQIIEPRLSAKLRAQAAKLSYPWQAVVHLYWCQIFALKCARVAGVNPDRSHRDDARYDKAFRLAAF